MIPEGGKKCFCFKEINQRKQNKKQNPNQSRDALQDVNPGLIDRIRVFVSNVEQCVNRSQIFGQHLIDT